MGLFSKKAPPTIDLRERQPSGAAAYQFGFPTRCPECGQRSYLDHIDPFRHVQHEHCPSCNARWELAEAEVAALNR